MIIFYKTIWIFASISKLIGVSTHYWLIFLMSEIFYLTVYKVSTKTDSDNNRAP